MKKLDYVYEANHPYYRPRPYQYREQLIHGRKAENKIYTIGQVIAAYLELTGISAYQFARNVTAWSIMNGYYIKLGPSSVLQYIHGVCKPKSEIRDLIATYLGMDDSFITGYRDTGIFEGLIENRINATAGNGIRLETVPGDKIETRPGIKFEGPHAA